MNDIINGYIEALLFAEGYYSDDPLYDADGLADNTIEAIEKLCGRFYCANAEECDQYIEAASAEQLGHDLYFSSNGHAVGFFDRDWCTKDIRNDLQRAAEIVGSSEYYLGDDNLIYKEGV
jgi:hypothetical protein